ncbi:MAG: hypothetical protein WC738_04275 [Candidatus Omnitrophota bacterium]|jgi:hypothetical protein
MRYLIVVIIALALGVAVGMFVHPGTYRLDQLTYHTYYHDLPGIAITNNGKTALYVGDDKVTKDSGYILKPGEGLSMETNKITIVR